MHQVLRNGTSMQMSLQVENRNKVSYKLAKTHNGNENGIHRQVCVTLSSLTDLRLNVAPAIAINIATADSEYLQGLRTAA